MRALGFSRELDLVNWNDDVGRTHAEVLERVDNAIKELSNGNG